MPIQIVSGNLNVWGNNGNFETDRSTWGFSDNAGASYLRNSSWQTKNLYSCEATILANNLLQKVAPGRVSVVAGKKYVAYAKVRCNTANPPADDTVDVAITSFEPNPYPFNPPVFTVQKTVNQIKNTVNTFFEIESRFECILTKNNVQCDVFLLRGLSDPEGLIPGGKIYIDEFEIYEYIDVVDPDPEEPDPTADPIPDKVFFHKNPITFEKTASVGWEAINNYRLYMDTRVQDVLGSGIYNSKLKCRLYPQTDGKVNFYVRQAFLDVMNPIPPPLNHSDIIRLTDRIKFFRTYTGQLQNDEVTPGALTESLSMLVLWGGVNKYHYPDLNYFTDYVPTNKKFLTWAPIEKNVDPDQEDYLNFWVYDDTIASLKLRIKAYYDDGTNTTSTVKTLAGVLYGQLYQIPAGPANSGVAGITPAKNLVKYELSLLDQDNVVITEVRTYLISLVRHPLTRFFMFLNPLGGFEVLRFTGQAEPSTDFDRAVLQKFLPHNYKASDGEMEVYSVNMQDKTNYSSGFFKGPYARKWKEYMQAFISSPKIFDVTTGERKRLICTTTNITGNSDRDYQRFIRFEGTNAFIDNSFTPSEI